MAANTIICATKGSKESQVAEDKAIELAKQNNSRLVFLYIIDIELLDKGGDVSEGAIEDLESGMKNIGNVILESAVEKAVESGLLSHNVSKAEVKGNFIEEIKKQVEQHDAEIVVIGHSHANKGFVERLLLSKDKPEIFEKKIREEIKCKVHIV
jgi:nucleotide-binding universal stress UspA family protein